MGGVKDCFSGNRKKKCRRSDWMDTGLSFRSRTLIGERFSEEVSGYRRVRTRCQPCVSVCGPVNAKKRIDVWKDQPVCNVSSGFGRRSSRSGNFGRRSRPFQRHRFNLASLACGYIDRTGMQGLVPASHGPCLSTPMQICKWTFDAFRYSSPYFLLPTILSDVTHTTLTDSTKRSIELQRK